MLRRQDIPERIKRLVYINITLYITAYEVLFPLTYYLASHITLSSKKYK